MSGTERSRPTVAVREAFGIGVAAAGRTARRIDLPLGLEPAVRALGLAVDDNGPDQLAVARPILGHVDREQVAIGARVEKRRLPAVGTAGSMLLSDGMCGIST
jgi:hypothetical protein